LTIGLTYEATADQMEKAIATIKDTILAVKGIEQDTIETRFVNFGAFSLDLDVVYWVTDMGNWKIITHNINMGLKRNLDNAGIDMAFPTETHYVVNQK
jgi:MscS family membrane protein